MTAVRRRGRPRHPDVLTPAEWRIVDAVRHGMTNRQIAKGRRISIDAVKFHVANAVGKLMLSGRSELKTWHGAARDSALARRQTGMVTELKLGPIGQIARHVADVGKAETWYRDVLGLAHLYTFPSSVGSLAFFDCGGTRLFLSQEGKADAEQSVLYFRVPDIEAAHRQLTARGVEFIDAPHMIFKHPDGMEEWMTFFKDLDGGMLALMSQVKA
jgi:DNA-binding CsgD family transcriptional regulator/catechol 2,3-dioxygenase-like lactoylglutathione lyase family enzyme